MRSGGWVKLFLLLFLIMSACSAQHKPAHDDFLADPFSDPFFTDAAEWDSSVLEQSEVLSRDIPKDPEEPTSFVEKSEQALLGAVMIGGGVARLLLLPLLGL